MSDPRDTARKPGRYEWPQLITWGMVAVTVGMALIVLAVVWFTRSEELARMTVTDSPSRLEFVVEHDTVVEIWAQIDLRVEASAGDHVVLSRLPFVLSYDINARQGEREQEISCNPLRTEGGDWRSENADPSSPLSFTKRQVTYLSRLRSCGLLAKAGSPVVLEARRSWLDPSWRQRFHETELVVRMPGVKHSIGPIFDR